MKLISSNSFLTAATAAATLIGAIATATLISTTVTADDMKHQSSATNADHSQHDMSNHSGINMMAEEVIASGMVKGVLSETAQLKVQHQPITEWKMAGMQMKFNLAPGVSVADLQEGQHIRFRLKQENMMKFTITEVLK